MFAFLKRRFYQASLHSLHGLKSAWQSEEAFRIEVSLGAGLIICGFIFGETAAEKALLIGSVITVLIAELLNTGLEKLVDRISLEKHQNSKFVKDVGSAAVALAIAQAIIVWLLILIPVFSVPS